MAQTEQLTKKETHDLSQEQRYKNLLERQKEILQDMKDQEGKDGGLDDGRRRWLNKEIDSVTQEIKEIGDS